MKGRKREKPVPRIPLTERGCSINRHKKTRKRDNLFFRFQFYPLSHLLIPTFHKRRESRFIGTRSLSVFSVCLILSCILLTTPDTSAEDYALIIAALAVRSPFMMNFGMRHQECVTC